MISGRHILLLGLIIFNNNVLASDAVQTLKAGALSKLWFPKEVVKELDAQTNKFQILVEHAKEQSDYTRMGKSPIAWVN